MNRIIKTASLVTSGILVGALVRKYAQSGINFSKQSTLDSIKEVKNLFNGSNRAEDINNYFI